MIYRAKVEAGARAIQSTMAKAAVGEGPGWKLPETQGSLANRDGRTGFMAGTSSVSRPNVTTPASVESSV